MQHRCNTQDSHCCNSRCRSPRDVYHEFMQKSKCPTRSMRGHSSKRSMKGRNSKRSVVCHPRHGKKISLLQQLNPFNRKLKSRTPCLRGRLQSGKNQKSHQRGRLHGCSVPASSRNSNVYKCESQITSSFDRCRRGVDFPSLAEDTSPLPKRTGTCYCGFCLGLTNVQPEHCKKYQTSAQGSRTPRPYPGTMTSKRNSDNLSKPGDLRSPAQYDRNPSLRDYGIMQKQRKHTAENARPKRSLLESWTPTGRSGWRPKISAHSILSSNDDIFCSRSAKAGTFYRPNLGKNRRRPITHNLDCSIPITRGLRSASESEESSSSESATSCKSENAASYKSDTGSSDEEPEVLEKKTARVKENNQPKKDENAKKVNEEKESKKDSRENRNIGKTEETKRVSTIFSNEKNKKENGKIGNSDETKRNSTSFENNKNHGEIGKNGSTDKTKRVSTICSNEQNNKEIRNNGNSDKTKRVLSSEKNKTESGKNENADETKIENEKNIRGKNKKFDENNKMNEDVSSEIKSTFLGSQTSLRRLKNLKKSSKIKESENNETPNKATTQEREKQNKDEHFKIPQSNGNSNQTSDKNQKNKSKETEKQKQKCKTKKTVLKVIKTEDGKTKAIVLRDREPGDATHNLCRRQRIGHSKEPDRKKRSCQREDKKKKVKESKDISNDTSPEDQMAGLLSLMKNCKDKNKLLNLKIVARPVSQE